MAAVGYGAGFCRAGWQPSFQLIRHGSKAVTRHWKPMHFVRQKLMEVTEYIPPKPLIAPECMPRVKVAEEEHGFVKFLRRQVEQTFLENNMIAVCQYNYAPGGEIVLMRHRLRKYNIHAKFFPNEIITTVLMESKYKNLLPLFVGRTLLLVSPETRAQEMLRVLKSIPQIVLLGGCVDNTLLSREGFANYAKLSSLVATQGAVVGALSVLPSQTSTILQRGPVHLTSLLDQYVKQQTGDGAEAKEGGDS
ncbi:PREDICTED: 39S ribosomal protein L10, mitochondrial [Gekko japonicus]|uniref:Large ribosomal subunit protein uL10m n=1 Tax=Gekko japonicus TaxID=146911 RepID=A0ABM1K2J9_GEKJA|nr:PREDICTED: 39S ribosomal protein L10, mitochondrial [Gekko japonicus]